MSKKNSKDILAERFAGGIDPKAECYRLRALLSDAKGHLDYCGYGDSWERYCSEGLQNNLDKEFESDDR